MSDRCLVSSIRGVSRVVIARLQESTELSDVSMIDRTIKEIRCTNGQMADALDELAKSFAYDKILYLIQMALEQDVSR